MYIYKYTYNWFQLFMLYKVCQEGIWFYNNTVSQTHLLFVSFLTVVSTDFEKGVIPFTGVTPFNGCCPI